MNYILQDRDGDYVLNVDSTGMETVKWHFEFTEDRKKAKVFTYDALFSRLATNPPGEVFIRGFSGGKAIEVE